MSSVKLRALLDGVPRLIRAVELTNVAVHERTKAAIRRGTERVVSRAQSLAPRRTGELAFSIRAEFGKDGMVGWAKAGYGKLPRRSRSSSTSRQSRLIARHRADAESRRLQFRLANNSKQALSVADLGEYAPVVEHGDPRRHKPKRPFLIPAFQQSRDEIVADLTLATKQGAQAGGLA